MSSIIQVCCCLPIFCCFPKIIQAQGIVKGVIDTHLNDRVSEISGYSFNNKWSSRINHYECKQFKQVLFRNLRNVLIKHKISVFNKNGFWSIYVEKQLSYAIFQKVIGYYDNPDIEVLLLDIPTNTVWYNKSTGQTVNFTDKIKEFLRQFASNKEGTEIDLNTTDPAIVKALDLKFMNILDTIVGDVDFIDNIVNRINCKFENDENARIAQEQNAISLIVP